MSLTDDTADIISMERNTPANVINLNTVSDSKEPHSCGYCHNPEGQLTWGFVSKSFVIEGKKLSADVYEELINKGWRRCGTYYYKVNLDKSCCKCYTIRMDVSHFKIKKQQRKTVKHMLDLVKQKKPKSNKPKNEVKPVEPPPNKHKEKPSSSVEKKLHVKMELEMSPEAELSLTNLLGVLTDKLAAQKEELLKLVRLKEGAQFNFEIKGAIKLFASKAGGPKGNYYSNYAMLLYGKNKQALDKTTMHEFCHQTSAYLVEQLRLISHEYDYRVDLSGYLIFSNKGTPTKQKKDNTEEYEVIQAFPSSNKSKDPGSEPKLKKRDTSEEFVALQGHSQKKKTEELKIIEEEDSMWPALTMTDSKITFGRLEVDIVPVEQSPESFALYTKYAKNIHNKTDKSMSSYTGFLCEDALEVEREVCELEKPISYNVSWDEKSEHLKPIDIKGNVVKRLGCYHMKYVLDGRLIGVGVVDLMPQGLSSVYFFYDHTFKEYRLGVFSSLVEIQYLRYLNKVFPDFRYYYMGFYIQNCQKMNYKADYEPCELLCPATFTYVPVDKQLKEKIEAIMTGKIPLARLTEPTAAINPDMVLNGDVGVFVDKNLKLFYRQRPITLKDLDKRFFVPILTTLKSHVQVIGRNLFLRFKYEI